jgi:hypothetical protein
LASSEAKVLLVAVRGMGCDIHLSIHPASLNAFSGVNTCK